MPEDTTNSEPSAAAATTPSFNPVQFIRTRRTNAREHTDEELQWWIDSYAKGLIPDYQMSAWLMAVCLQGLSSRETATLTRCMVQSGVTVQWRQQQQQQQQQSNVKPPPPPLYLVDKHSTGGIGDKVSLILAPLVATFGVTVPMMAGRGLGHTGGTIDKLESIPGFRTDLSVEEFMAIAKSVGCVISAANSTLAPADQKMYRLRDVTDTVNALSLKTASIMCKKIAENPDSLVLDVKYGSGAFQADLPQAQELAQTLVATGEVNGLNPTTAFLTRMDHPIGCAVGNWLEVKECIQIMGMNGNNNKNNDDDAASSSGTKNTEQDARLQQDLISLVTYQAAQMLLQSSRFPDQTFDELVLAARERLLNNGTQVLHKFAEMVAAQGGDATLLLNPENYPFKVAQQGQLIANQSGYIADMHCMEIGVVAVELGAGRRVAEDGVDFCAGMWFQSKIGDAVIQDETVIANVYTNKGPAVLKAALEHLQKCIVYTNQPVVVPPIVSHRVTINGMEEI